jgi:hypothetical protein
MRGFPLINHTKICAIIPASIHFPTKEEDYEDS